MAAGDYNGGRLSIMAAVAPLSRAGIAARWPEDFDARAITWAGGGE
jgi:hypothetical protein